MLRDEWREPLRALRDPLAATDRRVRARRDRKRQWRKQTWLGRFVSTYGWRAYALPVLMVLTTVVVYQTVTGTSTPRPAAAQTVRDSPAIGVVGTAILDAPPRGLAVFDANLPAGTLPDGGPFTELVTRPGVSFRALLPRSVKAPSKCSGIPSRSRTVLIPQCTAVTTHSPRWSTRR